MGSAQPIKYLIRNWVTQPYFACHKITPNSLLKTKQNIQVFFGIDPRKRGN